MIKSACTVALASTLLFSLAASAQTNTQPPSPLATTPDGKSQAADATGTSAGSMNSNDGTHHKAHTKKSKHSSSSIDSTSSSTSPNMQVTRDGKTPTPDATLPAGK